MGDVFVQAGHGVRVEWGPAGAERLAGDVACLVVVDVLSFTTSVTVAIEAGTQVFPYRWRDESAVGFAEQVGAALAVGRRAVTEASPWSLSPAALRRAPFTPRPVLPSPKGSAIAATAAVGSTVVAAALRNATAVARWLAAHGLGTNDQPVGVIAAGEHWPDGSLRPALEDLLGAGGVVAALLKCGGEAPSPEAAMAAAAFAGTPDPGAAVAPSSSGRELGAAGFADDVAVATELDVSQVVPVLTNGAFVGAG
ncbi:2-phosphosulfolactate phosphatase [Streptomyces sp. W16]|uniref:2-phosphosulfolactate phosphatase n=1 Tax=Streptomyces sp. W16 TaxID=3076631 RepID=UPI00295C06D9|nr:2-phosphosulfolactate phosphatase [Streptomyces sp. W16]MDV9169909.1 2-phosphosulfolactate phosphatase [Streptomyces sp. W16]